MGPGKGRRVWGSGFRVQGLGFRVQGLGFRVQGLGLRVQGLGFLGETCHRFDKLGITLPRLELERETSLSDGNIGYTIILVRSPQSPILTVTATATLNPKPYITERLQCTLHRRPSLEAKEVPSA